MKNSKSRPKNTAERAKNLAGYSRNQMKNWRAMDNQLKEHVERVIDSCVK